MAVSKNKKEAAAQVMEHLCEHEWHGYAQDARYGDGEGYCDVKTVVGTVKVAQGDRDCTSAVADAYTSVGVNVGGASYSGNFYECMVGTGNFRAHRMSDGYTCDDGYVAQRGDTYLAHNGYWQHAAMCTSAEPDMLAEFSINENGGISGGQTGDQTGKESLIHGFYGGHWDWVLELVTDGSGAQVAQPAKPTSNAKPSGGQSDAAIDAPMPEYRVKGKSGQWYDWMRGLVEISGKSGDDYAGSEGDPIVDIEFKNLGDGGWFVLNVKDVGELGRNQQNKTEHPLIGVTVYYATPDPGSTGYYRAMYRVHSLHNWPSAHGKWLKWEYDDEDGGAGDDANPIDLFQLTLSR